jgi:hypothetical protein
MKASIETVHEVLTNEHLEPDQINKILKQIEEQAAAEAEAAKAERGPTQKKQFVIILSDPSGFILGSFDKVFDLVGWVAQIPEDDDTATTMDRLTRAAYEYNTSKKGRKYPVKTIGEACEAVGARFLKEQGIAVKTKMPIQIVVTDNKIPEIESDF